MAQSLKVQSLTVGTQPQKHEVTAQEAERWILKLSSHSPFTRSVPGAGDSATLIQGGVFFLSYVSLGTPYNTP